MTKVARGTAAIMLFLLRSSAKERSLAFLKGSPSASFSSSLISCLVMRISLRQSARTQTRSAASSTTVGTDGRQKPGRDHKDQSRNCIRIEQHRAGQRIYL